MNTIRKLFFFLLVFLSFLQAGMSQDEEYLDSLNLALSTANEDTLKARLLHEIYKNYEFSNFEKAEAAARAMFTLSDQLEYKWGLGKAHYNLGYLDLVQGQYSSALDNFEQALEYGKEISNGPITVDAAARIAVSYMKMGDLKKAIEYNHIALEYSTVFNDKVGRALVLSDLGVIYNENFEFSKSLDYHLQALAIFRQLNDESNVGVCLSNVGSIFQALGEYDNAIKAFEESIAISQKLNANYSVAKDYSTLGVVYRKKKDYTKAFELFSTSETIIEKYKDTSLLADIAYYTGSTYFEMKDFPKSRSFYIRSLELKEKIKQKKGIVLALNAIANTYLKEQNYPLAETYLNRLKPVFSELNHLPLQKEVSKNLYLLEQGKGNYKAAFSHLQTFTAINDSILDVERAQKLAVMQAGFESTQREQEIKLLSSKNEVQQLTIDRRNKERIYLVIFLIALLSLVALIYSRYRLKAKTQKKLEELDQLKSQFFTNVSHEFRTPLSLILGPLEDQMQKVNNPEAQEDFDLMHRNASRISRLVDQIMELSKIDAGNLKLEVTKESITEFLKALFYSFSSHAEFRKIDYELNFPQRSIESYFDQDKIEKIVYNLISNAFKYTSDEGKIKVTVYEVKDYLSVKIENSGKGISQEELNHIFERFYRISDERRFKEGSGVGLALVKELVDIHHGKITVESIPNEYTIFEFRIPLQDKFYTDDFHIEKPSKEQNFQSLPFSPARLEIADQENSILDQPTILLIDDNSEIRHFIAKQLGNQYKIIEASDGAIGLQKAYEYIPDLIISDLMMPNMDGNSFCQAAKTDERTAHIPIIMLTARADIGSKIGGLEKGADAYLTKPFNAEELRVRVRNIIAQRQQLKSHYSQILFLEPTQIELESVDELFIKRAMELVEKNLDDAEFGVQSLQRELGMSRTQLHRKLTALLNQSGNEFIRVIRLKRAAQYIGNRSHNISEAAYAVGFNNLSYFAKCFKAQFGVSPSKYVLK